MTEKFDLIIIGAGPAGLSAGIYAGRAKRKTLILEKGGVGGRAALTEKIVNYPGFSDISGAELTEKMKVQAEGFGVTIRRETVKNVVVNYDNSKSVFTRKNEYIADAVIAAAGTSPRVLGISGEEEFTGRGVAYCAACDAEFFKEQTVVVLGSGDQAIEESEFIARFASKVIIVVIHDEGKPDCNRIAAERAYNNPKISFVWNSTIVEICGNENVNGVILKNIKENSKNKIACDGVFLFAGAEPNVSFLSQALRCSKNQWIKTNEHMETGVTGIFAAGDVRDKTLRQISTAVNDGAVAAVMADAYLEQKDLYEDLKKQSFSSEIGLIFWSSKNGIGAEAVNIAASSEIDIAKNPYLAEYFGITEEDMADGFKYIKFKNGKLYKNS